MNSHYLRNHLSKEDAQKRLSQEPFDRRVISFYRYVILENPVALRDELFAEWMKLSVLGRIYLATEGINAQMSVPEPNFEKFQELLFVRPEFSGVPFKVGVEQRNDAFWKLTIKVKKQIVADGLRPEEYDVTDVGTHLTAREWNERLDHPEAVVVDMRNNYESAVGRFDTAFCPDAYSFREELPLVRNMLQGKEDKEVLLYCTGGIRCEKASAYLKHYGFKNVYQLHGGIIDYKHQVEREGLPSKFKGKNFVFDERLGERITEDILGTCFQCGTSCDEYTNCMNEQCNLLFIQCIVCCEKFSSCCSIECQKIAALPGEERTRLRRGRTSQKNYALFRSKVALVRS